MKYKYYFQMKAEKDANEENMKGWTQNSQKNIVISEPC